jgi:hypothetical protein
MEYIRWNVNENGEGRILFISLWLNNQLLLLLYCVIRQKPLNGGNAVFFNVKSKERECIRHLGP